MAQWLISFRNGHILCSNYFRMFSNLPLTVQLAFAQTVYFRSAMMLCVEIGHLLHKICPCLNRGLVSKLESLQCSNWVLHVKFENRVQSGHSLPKMNNSCSRVIWLVRSNLYTFHFGHVVTKLICILESSWISGVCDMGHNFQTVHVMFAQFETQNWTMHEKYVIWDKSCQSGHAPR